MANSKKPLWGAADNNLILLFAINAFAFIIINFLRLAYAVSYDTNAEAEIHFQSEILHWFVLHAKPLLLLHKPWTLLLSMFSHYSVASMIGNMIWLWVFGFIIQDLSGNKRLFPIYVYGGLAGAIIFLLAVNFLPFVKNNLVDGYYYIGAGASVMAIAVAATTLVPNYRFFTFINGGIPIWVLTLIFVAIDFANVSQEGSAYSFAHLAGAAVGFFYIKQLQKGNDWGSWMSSLSHKIGNLFTPKKSTNYKFEYYKNENPIAPKAATESEIDRILDKINEQGYDKLTQKEKDILNKAGK